MEKKKYYVHAICFLIGYFVGYLTDVYGFKWLWITELVIVLIYFLIHWATVYLFQSVMSDSDLDSPHDLAGYSDEELAMMGHASRSPKFPITIEPDQDLKEGWQQATFRDADGVLYKQNIHYTNLRK